MAIRIGQTPAIEGFIRLAYSMDAENGARATRLCAAIARHLGRDVTLDVLFSRETRRELPNFPKIGPALVNFFDSVVRQFSQSGAAREWADRDFQELTRPFVNGLGGVKRIEDGRRDAEEFAHLILEAYAEFQEDSTDAGQFWPLTINLLLIGTLAAVLKQTGLTVKDLKP